MNTRSCTCDPSVCGQGCACSDPSCCCKQTKRYGSIEMDSLEKGGDRRMQVVDIAVGGMTCSMCSDAVHKALVQVPGIQSVSVSLATNLARIEYVESSECNIGIIQETIEDIGYDVNDVIVPKTQTPPAAAAIQTVELAVGGMTCSMCSNAVHAALVDMPGVKNVNVSLSTNVATVQYEESPDCNPEILKETIEDIGYDVNDVILPKPKQPTKTVELAVGGMTCSMCSSAVHAALVDMPGVKSVNVSLSTNVATVEYEESPECNPDTLKETIEDIGYDVNDVIERQSELEQKGVILIEEEDDRLFLILRQQDMQLRARKRGFIQSFVGALPILSITMFIPRVFDEGYDLRQFLESDIEVFGHTFLIQALLLWLLATPVQFGCGYPFYKTSYYGISRGVLGMDVLVALGTTSSYLYAVMSTWTGDPGYRFFETSAVLLCFVLLGKWMNAMAICRTSEALTNLMKLQVKTALKVKPSGKKDLKRWDPLVDGYEEEIVSIQAVKSGDIVKVLKGASIPADGLLMHGEMCVDESMITGESVPVLKVPGSAVLGGTICSETGTGSFDTKETTAAAFVQVTGVGSSTALAQIVQLVQQAQSRQVPIQNLADTIAGIFVPTVVCLSLFTFLAWYGCCKSGIVPTSWYHGESPSTFSLLFAIACLVISCPCALGLATPTAVMVGTGVGARHGILMKGGETLEVASRIDCIVFDKTGTLTRGKPAVTDFKRVATDDELRRIMDSAGKDMTVDAFLMWLLGSLERNSEHPLAAAIVTYTEEKLGGLLDQIPFAQPSNFLALTGRGTSGVINGKIKVSMGNRAFASRENLVIADSIEQTMQEFEAEGKTAILVGLNGTVSAVLGLADQVKEGAAESIRYLKDMGIDVWMVTGDSARTASAIARYLDLSSDRVISEALPSSKVDQVQMLQSLGHRVAMVGDGVNDSPALVEADVGMSMGTGAEIATEASDMVLVSGKVTDVCTAVNLSRVIFRRIQLNLLFSMVYNLLAIPLAAGAFFPIFQTRLPPTVAALAMALSSVSVVFSSLALRLYRPPKVTGELTPSRLERLGRIFRRRSTVIQYAPVSAQELEIV
jgi:Cu+-exporting ATPase